jgi:hypothetical protein
MKKKLLLSRNHSQPSQKVRTKHRRPSLSEEVNERLDLLPKVMNLGGFLSASVRPQIRDSEIIVCFADIRGFTEYCKRLQEDSHDRKIQNFLQRYFSIFVEGMVAWRTQWDRGGNRWPQKKSGAMRC